MSRSYSSQLTGTTAMGNLWMGGPAEMYLIQEGADLSLLKSADAKTKFTGSGSPPTYTAPDNSYLELSHDATNDEYIVTDEISNVRYVFHDFTIATVAHRGKLKEQTTRQWDSQTKGGFEYSWSAGKISQITTPDGQDYSIVFTYSGDSITKVEIKDGTTVLEKVEYTYYDDVTTPSTDIGSSGDLVQVKVSRQATKDSAGTLSIIRYTQYRYDSASKLKAVYRHDAIQRILSKLQLNTPDDILQKADTFGTPDVQDFASRSFEYYASATSTSSIDTPFTTAENLNSTYGGAEMDESNMVKSEAIGGSCTSCGGTNSGLKKTYFYTSLAQGATLDQNEVVRIVIEDTEDENGTAKYRTVYGLNDTGRLLRKAFIENPTGTPSYWCESWKMATSGLEHRLAEYRKPSAHSVTTAANLRNFLDPYDSEGASWTNDDNTLNASDGVIQVYTYNSDGMPTDAKVKKGKNGTAYYVWAADYGDGDGDSAGDDNANNVLLTAAYFYATQTTTRTNGKKTTYDFTFWDTDDREIKTITTSLPSVSTGQNGSGVATETVEYYDNLARLRWTKDGGEYVHYRSYNPVTGGLAYAATDIDPSSPGTDVTSGSAGNCDAWTVGSANTNKPTRGSGLPTAIKLVQKSYYDDQGRLRQTEDAGGGKHYTAYEDDRTIGFPYWDSTNSKTLLPIGVAKLENGVQTGELIGVKAGYTSVSVSAGKPTTFSTEPTQSDYVAWTKNTYDDTNGRLNTTDRYHDIPSTGNGTLSTNFYRTVTNYDGLGRTEYIIQVVSGSSATDRKEQVTQSVYDVRDRVIEVKRGVSGDSAANSHNMTDNYTTYPTMRTITKTEYDDDGVGDGHVTKVSRYHGTGTNDFTGGNYKRTYRGHVRGIEPFYMNVSTETAIGPYTVQDVNWQGQTTSTALYDTALTWSSVLTGDGYTDYADSTSTNRRTRVDNLYDDLGRVYQTRRYKIAESTGLGSDYLSTNIYRDRNGRQVAQQLEHAAATETAYDGAGRAYQTRTVLDLESTKFSSGKFQYRAPTPHPTLSSMTGGDDWLLEMSHQAFDANNVTEVHTFEDNHDDAVSASRGIDLTNNDDYVRRSVYNWYDAADRMEATADYGSGDTSAGAGTWKYAAVPSRPSTAPTASSDTKLVTLLAYNADTGRQETVTDPAGTKSKSFYDDLGRNSYTAENYDNFNASTEANTGDATDESKDRVTKFVYNGLGQRKSLVAMDANADGNLSDNQTTTYLYEDAVDASWVTNEIYPDSADTTSSGTDQVKFQYNTDGSRSKQTDQRGTVLDYTYTNARNLQLTKVTTLGGSTDGHVRSIKRSYDDMARLEKLTSYSNSDGTGTVRNEIQYEYNDLDQFSTSYQSHEAAVITASTPKVQYAYDATVSTNVFSRQHRLEKVTYPDGRVTFNDYDTANADYPSNRLSRIRKLRETSSTGTELAIYDYNGGATAGLSNSASRRLALVDLPEPDVKLDLYQGTAGTYAGLDRFGRTKDQYWDGYGTTADVDRLKYDYDDAGSRTYRDIDSAIYTTNDKDQAYTYDGLHRLKTSDEGTLSGTTISGTPKKEEDYTLDALGNWSGFVTKTSGTTDLNQSRTNNDVNEITDITETTGPAWVTPAHDAAGNMTTIPKPAALTAGYTATYDAWNRLVKIVDGANTVAEYEYDGLNRRIVKSIYSGGSLDHRQRFYYNGTWQVLEVRKEVSGTEDADPLEQYVWHPHYVDALVLRDYDADVDGTSVRHYYIQDANYNVTAVADDSGSVLERYHYTAYGQLQVLDADFSADADGQSDIANAVTFTGRRFDFESGLWYYRNRYYHPYLGRFISRDPIAYHGDLNLYLYVKASPTNRLDAFGLESTTLREALSSQNATPSNLIPGILCGESSLTVNIDLTVDLAPRSSIRCRAVLGALLPIQITQTFHWSDEWDYCPDCTACALDPPFERAFTVDVDIYVTVTQPILDWLEWPNLGRAALGCVINISGTIDSTFMIRTGHCE